MPFDAPQAARFVVFLTEEELHESWRFIQRDGRALIKGDAAVALLTELDATRWIGRFFAALRLQWLVGAIYTVISRSRPWLSRLVRKQRPPLLRLPEDGEL